MKLYSRMSDFWDVFSKKLKAHVLILLNSSAILYLGGVSHGLQNFRVILEKIQLNSFKLCKRYLIFSLLFVDVNGIKCYQEMQVWNN